MKKSSIDQPQEKNPITVFDVAAKARVSIATVSRVLSGEGGVSERLEKRVRDAAQLLDYHPNLAARRLRKRTTKIVGVVVSDIQNPFFTTLISGIENILQEVGYLLILGNSSESPLREQGHLETFMAELVSGVIFATTMKDVSYYQKLQLLGIPLVAIDRAPVNLNVDSVQIENANASQKAIIHFVQSGYKRIGLISGPEHISTAYERRVGYERALLAADLSLDPDLIQVSNFRQAGGYQSMQSLLDMATPPSAVLISNNLMTLGALQMIHERGLDIPGDIALIGFDDMPWASSLRPPLTVVAQPVLEMGSIAAKLLLERIQNPNKPVQHIKLEAELVIRASCGCTRSFHLPDTP
jgi:LacI family transcriptional regulator